MYKYRIIINIKIVAVNNLHLFSFVPEKINIVFVYLTINQHLAYILPSPLYNNKKNVINRVGIFVNWTESSTFVAKIKKLNFKQ